MRTGQSFTSRRRTDWLPMGMPASASLRQASRASAVISFGWLKCVLTYRGWYFLSMFTRSSVMRMGMTTGVRVPMRMISRWGISRRRLMMLSSFASERVRGSPPEMMTSRMTGVFRMYSMAFSMFSSFIAASSSPTRRRRVQWRQFIEQMCVTRRRARSG